MTGTSLNVLLFLISIIFDAYAIVLIIRLILAWARTDYSHPITQFVANLTGFIVNPLRKILPDIRGLELSTIVLILVVIAIKFFLIFMLSFGLPNLLGVLILTVADSIKLILEVLIFAIFVHWIVSWLQPNAPVNQVLRKLTIPASPLIKPLQSIIPPIGGFDWSWLPAVIILALLIIIVVHPLLATGLGVAIG